MGKSDLASKNWLQDRRRYADLFNGVIFGGRQMIQAEELEPISGEADVILTDKDGKEQKIQRYRDIVMKWKKGIHLAVCACENQKNVHYAMPVRIMLYDGLSYVNQMDQIWKLHEQDKSTKNVESEEWLSKFRRDDRLIPVISIVFYYGSKEWDAATSLYDMLDFPEGSEEINLLEEYIPNYRINLLDAGKVEHVERFKTDLQELFQMLKYREEKEKLAQYVTDHRDYFGNIDRDTFLAFGEFLQAGKFWKNIIPKTNQNGGKIDMCKALQDLYDEGVEHGMERGIEQKVYELVKKKLARGKTVAVIADELEESEGKIQDIIDRIQKTNPES